MRAIYKKELATYFRSPIGWIAIAITSILTGIFFSTYLFNQFMDMSGEFSFLQTWILFITPLITMRLFSEEKKNGTDVLMYTHPVSLIKVVLGKYLAAMTLLAIMTSSMIFQAFVTFVLGGLIDATTLGSAISFFVICGVFVAIGIFISAFTENQIVAAIISVIVTLVLNFFLSEFAARLQGVVTTILGFFSSVGVSSATATEVGTKVRDGVLWMDPVSRMRNLYTGIFEVSPIVYCLSLVALFLFFTYRILEKRRWSQG